MLSIQTVHQANREKIVVGATELAPSERVTLHQDLRPYLESLRREGAPSTRGWLPYRQWLLETEPLTTAHSLIGDRRKARLALLLRPEEVARKIKEHLPCIKESDGIVILVCCPDDPEGSGALMEVAHMCAAEGASVNVLFAPPLGIEDPRRGVLAMARELERAVIMAGEDIFSDRGGSPVGAKRLFDRVLVLRHSADEPKTAAIQAAELIWDMLAYREVPDEMPTVKYAAGEVQTLQAELDTQVLPQRSLWNWVRDRTLAMAVNGQFLGVQVRGDKLVLPAVDPRAADEYSDSFWSGQGLDRPRNSLVVQGRTILTAPVAVTALLALQAELPVGDIYEKQKEYCDRERKVFAAYLEEWAHHVLEREHEKGTWGLPPCVVSLRQLEDDFQNLLEKMNQMSGNETFVDMVKFASALIGEFQTAVSELRSGVTAWIGVIAGASAELDCPGPEEDRTPLCYELERSRRESEEALVGVHPATKSFRDRIFDKWYDTHGKGLVDQMRFRVAWRAEEGDFSVAFRLPGREHVLDDDLAESLRETLDEYRNVIAGWAMEEWLEEREIGQPAQKFRVGKRASAAYPNCDRTINEDDPFIAAAIGLDNIPLARALGVVEVHPIGLPFAWPEEANAARIATKIENRLQRSPEPFPATVTHLMRDTAELHAFFADLAEGRVLQKGPKFELTRAGKAYTVGPTSDALNGLDTFLDVVRQVVSFRRSITNEELPPRDEPWSASPDEALRQIEQHPLVTEATQSPEWKVWQDVIRGVVLEHGGEAQPDG
jgi:hypothetical protein